jgi:hypothetical protein
MRKKGSGLDPDAEDFLDAAVITDPTIVSAINTLVIDIKDAGLWNKMYAIYPFVGGTASTHKWNLKDPRDLDDAYRLTFLGTNTHSSNGYLTVTLGRANTHLVPSSVITINNTYIGAYVRTNITGAYLFYAIGSAGASSSIIQFFAKISNLIISDMYNSTGSSSARVTSANTDSTGYFSASRILTDTEHSIYKNGDLKNSSTGSAGSLPNNPIYIGATNDGGGTQGLELAFANIGQGLSDSEESDLYTIIQTFQTSLSRQV